MENSLPFASLNHKEFEGARYLNWQFGNSDLNLTDQDMISALLIDLDYYFELQKEQLCNESSVPFYKKGLYERFETHYTPEELSKIYEYLESSAPYLL